MRPFIAVVLSCALPIAGCGRRSTPLSHTFPSADALATAVLDAVARNDGAGLQALALSEVEFREHVWPELPVSRPERGVPFDYVWGDLSQKSRGYLQQTLAAHRGRRYRLVKVEFLGNATRYRTFEVARKAQLIVRDERGQEQAVRLFGSVLKSDSEFKLFSYVVD